MICLNCGNEMSFYFEKKGFKIFKCPKCLLMAVNNIPADLTKYYSEGYFTGDVSLDGYMDYDSDKEVTKKTYLNFLCDIERFLPAGQKKSLFEVGCATGFFLKLATELGWEAEGIDLSDYAVKMAILKGIKASVGTVEDFKAENKYDAVVMQDVVEHVRDPASLITKAGELLKAGGVLALTTPDSGSLWARVWGKRWHAFVPPQHLYYFSSENIKSFLEKRGFKVEYLEHHGKWFTVPYIIRLFYSWTGFKFFSKLAELASKSFFKNISLPINVRDTIYLIAKKYE
ncbi:MAG: class I SAM-dependent methyltransferase [Patescibacteria group bacterium]|jgi:2-polyprenyl-3-methyl-5-hydroxy-6-metoxy-1,4-benzoquinol methylase